MMLIQEHPDDVRKNGIMLDGIVTRVSETVSGRRGNDPGGYYVHARAMKDGFVVKEDVVFNVSISSYSYFSVGDNVKIWEYKDVFYLDEYHNMEPTNRWPWQLVLTEAVCLVLIIYLYLRRRKR